MNTEEGHCCAVCHYATPHVGNFAKHCVSRRHLNNQKKLTAKTSFDCSFCARTFKHRSGLWKHKKQCSAALSSSLSSNELVLHLLKQNSELQHQLVELAGAPKTIVQNNAFNVQVFLNETCKHAMNIDDFVRSIQVRLEDLETTGQKGYVEGVSNIIVKNLTRMEQHLRPLHCSDVKREVLYVRDNNQWLRESDNKSLLVNAIRSIAHENIKQIEQWKRQHPECLHADATSNATFLQIVRNAMDSSSDNEEVVPGSKNVKKIISNIAKCVSIDRNV